MKVLKQNMRLVLMSLLLIICGATFAQTQVVFEAGVDKGQNSAGNHHIDKDGITFGGTRCNLGSNPYDFQTLGGAITSQKLTVTSTVGNIQKIEIIGSKLNIIDGQNVGTFDSSTGVWEGNSNNVELNIPYTFSSKNKVTVSKVIVTLASSVATTLSFGEDAQENYTVFRGQEKNFTALKATLTDDRTDEAIEGNVKYSSNNADVVSVDETTGALTFGNIGTATITASFDGVEGAYEPAESISYTIDYKKNSLELAYSKSLDVIYADNKDSYEIPSITITSTLDTDDLAINYETSNADVATVDEKGKITLVGNGEATITASVKDNNLFDDATATYTVRVADPDNIFYESFDNIEGKGGNDGTWEAGDGDTFNSALCDNEGWYEKSTTGGTYQTVLQGDKCLNIYGQAALISGDMKYLNGAAILTFKAGAAVKNNPATPSLKITVVDGNKNIVEQSVEVPVGEFKEYSIVIPNGTPNTRLEFWGEQASNRFLVTVEYNIFIDDVKVVRLVPISETTDNTAILAANDGNDVNVKLDRKLSNEYWNTVCFPFNLSTEEVNTLFGEASQIREFNRVEKGEMVFVEPKTKAIVAGTPYLFKPENNIDNSLFFRATVDNSNNAVAYADAEGKEYKFVGVTSPTELLATDIFIGTDQSLYYPNMETEGANIINGMRAYIQLPEGTDAKAFAINTNGVATSISNINNTTDSNNTVYTISGQKVGKYNGNLPKGIYVMNGKKFVVK